MERTKWVDRKFTFDAPEGWIFNILERLHGAPTRIEEIVKGVTEDRLRFKPGGKWSIKEHVGHLYDLEALHEGRIYDFVMSQEILRAADMSNARTESSNHNDRPIEELINMFKERRLKLIEKFSSLDDATQMRKAMHPRLQVLMRPIDVAHFTAEHDDHHIRWMRELSVWAKDQAAQN